MALFKKVTKTRVSGTTGNAAVYKFINAYKEKSITIKMVGEDMKIYSITLYGAEVEYLEYMVNKAKYEEHAAANTEDLRIPVGNTGLKLGSRVPESDEFKSPFY